ncbi:MAG: glycosyltransferase family 4 protein [Kiritimatiellia bacterium]
MRILILSWNFPPALGGIEVVVNHLFNGLRHRGHEVRLLAPFAAAATSPDVERAAKKGIPSFLRFCLSRGAAICREFKPDVIVCGSIVSAPAAWWLSCRHKIPYVVLMHGSDILYGGRMYQTAVRFLTRRADRLAANSEGTRDLLLAAGCAPERIGIVHPGVDVPAFDRPVDGAPELPGVSLAGRRVLVTVGRLIRRKGVLEFITRVLPELVKTHPEVLYLVVGEDAKLSLAHKERLRDQIEARIRELGLENHARLLGKLSGDDLRRVLAASECFVLPCLDIPATWRGSGSSSWKPPCAAHRRCRRGWGDSGRGGGGHHRPAFAPGDSAALLANLRRMLDEPGLRDRLAAAAATRARDEFSWDAVTRRYEQLFAKAVAS